MPVTNEEICGESIETIRTKSPFTILTPTTLPEGYSLQTVGYVPNVAVTT
ncbi:MAG TPA: hypothetical protein VNI77_12355 [Nitrososphaera sp.]|nr:hypothetical protein [Nitrososphaera sp.]